MSSYLGTALQVILDDLKLTQRAFADMAEIDSTLLNRYVAGSIRPSKEVLEKICLGIESASNRAAIVVAHLRDETPPSGEELVRIVNLIAEPGGPRLREDAAEPATKPRLPKKAREDFAFLMGQAEKHPEIIEWIKATVDVMRAR